MEEINEKNGDYTVNQNNYYKQGTESELDNPTSTDSLINNEERIWRKFHGSRNEIFSRDQRGIQMPVHPRSNRTAKHKQRHNFPQPFFFLVTIRPLLLNS